MMVYRIIWADRVALRGAEEATGCRELAVVTTRKTCKESTNGRKAIKIIPLKGSHVIKSKIGE